MPFVTCHDTGDNVAILHTHQKQFRPDTKLALNVSVRIIPRPNQVASPPKFNDSVLVFRLKRTDLHTQVRLAGCHNKEGQQERGLEQYGKQR